MLDFTNGNNLNPIVMYQIKLTFLRCTINTLTSMVAVRSTNFKNLTIEVMIWGTSKDVVKIINSVIVSVVIYLLSKIPDVRVGFKDRTYHFQRFFSIFEVFRPQCVDSVFISSVKSKCLTSNLIFILENRWHS